ncbi:hypothetical protein GKD75_19385 [Odoribacter splanchnicus]|nr:hypothetical protein [Odoribacter splanchnicus]
MRRDQGGSDRGAAGLRKNAQGGDPERHPQDDMRVAVVRQHGPAGMRGRLPAVSQTASAAPGERFPGPAILPPVRPCGPLCGPMTGGAGPLPLPAGSGRCGPVVGGVAAQGFRPFLNGTEGRKKEQDKQRGRKRPCLEHLCPQCGQLRGLLRGLEMGSKSGP